MYNINDIDVLTPDGYKPFKGIKRSKNERWLYKIYHTKGYITVTDNHQVLTKDGFVEANKLNISDIIIHELNNCEIELIIPYQSDEYVYDLVEVGEKHEYYTNGIVSHNCSFLGSSSTLLDSKTLGELTHLTPIQENYVVDDLLLYRDLNPDAKYMVTVDTSKTVGKENASNDYISINVLEMNKKIYQTATWRSNSYHYKEVAEILQEIGEHFNYALIVIENNEGSGQSTADKLKNELEYENVYCDPKHNGDIAGIRCTAPRRQIGLTSLKKLIGESILEIYDEETISEFFSFIKIGKKYQADPAANATDDIIMSITTGIYVLTDANNNLELTLDDYLDDLVTYVDEVEQDNYYVSTGNNSNISQKEKETLLMFFG